MRPIRTCDDYRHALARYVEVIENGGRAAEPRLVAQIEAAIASYLVGRRPHVGVG